MGTALGFRGKSRVGGLNAGIIQAGEMKWNYVN